MFQPWRGQRSQHYDSNWLRYYNYARWMEHQRHAAYQYMNHVYYRTYEPILPFPQHLASYRNDYPEQMGIQTTKNNLLPQRNNEDLECIVCRARFTSSSALERHRRRHPHMQSDRKHRCHLCSYSTNNSINLKRHLLAHSGEKPYQCTQCHKAFTQKKNLQRHMFTHTGERPFSCSTCGKTFSASSNLRTHERVHTQEKPYRCQHCDFTSSNISNLHKHIECKHTRDFKHNCSFCEKGFTSPSVLKRHIEGVHSISKISNKESRGEPEVD